MSMRPDGGCAKLRPAVNPHEILLTVDAMTVKTRST